MVEIFTYIYVINIGSIYINITDKLQYDEDNKTMIICIIYFNNMK